MRHAKSSWAEPDCADIDRPLAERGRRAAPAIGRWLATGGWLPDEVIVSGAVRSGETWDLMAPELPNAPNPRTDRDVYEATPEALLGAIRRATAPTVLLVGHNPAIGEVADALVAEPPEHPKFLQYPTCATLVAEFDGDDWAATGWGDGRVSAFVVPRELG